MKNLKEVENKIKELMPGIMELKFGCEILWHTRKCKILRNSSDKNWYYIGDDNGESLEDISNLKILGRLITLEDVLMALSKKLENGDVLNFHLNDSGNLVFHTKEKIYDWILNKPLSEQSEALLSFLYDILCK